MLRVKVRGDVAVPSGSVDNLSRCNGVGSSQVFSGERGGDAVIVKVLSKAEARSGQEVLALQTVQGHAGVIRLLGLEEDAFSWFLIMERCDLDLQELLTRVPCGFPAPRAASWFLALAEALAHCHERGVYHGDIKPENVLLTTSWDVRLIDFGSASLKRMTVPVSMSKHYVAPEVHDIVAPWGRGQSSAADAAIFEPATAAPPSEYDAEKADMWSMGVLLCVLCSGKFPWVEPSLSDAAYRGWALCGVLPPAATCLPPPLKDLCAALLSVSPSARPTAAAAAGRVARGGMATLAPPPLASSSDTDTAILTSGHASEDDEREEEEGHGDEGGRGDSDSDDPCSACCDQDADSGAEDRLRGMDVRRRRWGGDRGLRHLPRPRPADGGDSDGDTSSVASSVSSVLCYSTAKIDLDGGDDESVGSWDGGRAPRTPIRRNKTLGAHMPALAPLSPGDFFSVRRTNMSWKRSRSGGVGSMPPLPRALSPTQEQPLKRSVPTPTSTPTSTLPSLLSSASLSSPGPGLTVDTSFGQQDWAGQDSPSCTCGSCGDAKLVLSPLGRSSVPPVPAFGFPGFITPVRGCRRRGPV